MLSAHITNVSYRMYHLLLSKVSMTTRGITSFGIDSVGICQPQHRIFYTCRLSHLWLHQAVDGKSSLGRNTADCDLEMAVLSFVPVEHSLQSTTALGMNNEWS